MREIKFRAWDEKEKCWVGGFAIHQSGMFSDWAGCKKVNGQCIADANWQYPQKIPYIKIMQYTGLKDGTKWEQLTKEEQNDWLQSGNRPEEWKGREIYEGDIYESEDGRDRGVIVFQNCSFEVKWIPPVTFGLRSLLYYNQNGKVVGNIYENPDLVGDQDGH